MPCNLHSHVTGWWPLKPLVGVAQYLKSLPLSLPPSGAGDWLVAQLALLVGVAFKMATGGTEALRPLGLRLLASVLHYYRGAADPQLEGARLLEQYQAQLVSALR